MNQNLAGGVCLSLCLLISWPSAAHADEILTWNVNAGKAAIAACLAPGGNALAESRIYAMAHAAMHDALNAIDRRSRPYVFDARATAVTSSSAAIAAAARDVLISVIMQLQESSTCIQNGVTSVEADYSAALAAIPNSDARRPAESYWDRPPPRPSSRCAPSTDRTRRCSILRIRKGPSLVNIDSRQVYRSRSRPHGAT